jgi:pilus assembly protein CpaF
MVNGKDSIFIERSGKLRKSELRFENDDELLATIEQICNAAGKRIDEHHPYCDARLENGSRIHAIIPPLCLNGPCLTIRKFPKLKITVEDLVESGSMPKELYETIRGYVEGKKNILISGGTSSGKTTLLNALSRFIAAKERIITIEDSAELQMQQPHVIRLESRKENLEGQGAVTIRDLVRNSLRMRPDRVVIGECRGEEALDMLQAMNTGHDGSMTTIHANTCRDSLRRLEVLVLFSQYDLPSRAICEQIGSAIHCIIQQTRFANGKRGVSEIVEVLGYNSEKADYDIKTIYKRDKHADTISPS